jgi:RHS repeat-associated protein
LYEAYGGIVLSTGSSQNNRLANTRERDFSIGLDNHGKRYFDPEIGRYISPDPAGFPDGLNNYLYCGNNPINRIDPQGLGWFSDVWDSAVQKFDAGLQTAANFSAGMADKLTGGRHAGHSQEAERGPSRLRVQVLQARRKDRGRP